MIDWMDERVLGPLAGLVAAIIVGWRLAKKVKITMGNGSSNGNGSQKTDRKARTELLCSIDASLKSLVDGQDKAIDKLDKVIEEIGETRRELAELRGAWFGGH